MTAMLPPLRDYQVDAYARLREAARRQTRPGYGLLAVAPTGAGKTRIALELATRAIAKQRRVLWLAPRTELIDQPVERLRACGWTDVQIVQADRERGSGPITVASIQTLVARRMAPPADLVIMDEARHYVASEWGAIRAPYAGAVRVGLDATPARADGTALGSLFDEIVEVASVEQLTRDDWLVPARIIAPAEATRDLSDTPENAYLEHAAGRRALVFCANVEHARTVADARWFRGIPAMSVDAHTPRPAREEAVRRLRAGDLRVLCNVALFTEGFDAPGVDCIIVARGVSHETTWLQMIGRGLRPASGRAVRGEDCIVIDLRGHVHRFGFPEDQRTWHLDGEPCRRAEALPPAVQCRVCHGWSRGGGSCPLCGAEKPPPPPPRVTKREMAERRRAAVPRRGERWELLERLMATARETKRGRRWVAHAYRAQTGHWPPWGVPMGGE